MIDSRIRPVLRWRWFWLLFYAGLIFAASSLPGRVAVGPVQRYDLILHFLEFLILGYLLGRTYVQDLTGSGARPGLTAVLIGLGYAGLDELHQKFVPGRFMELSDFLADGLGVLVGVSVHLWLTRRKRAD